MDTAQQTPVTSVFYKSGHIESQHEVPTLASSILPSTIITFCVYYEITRIRSKKTTSHDR